MPGAYHKPMPGRSSKPEAEITVKQSGGFQGIRRFKSGAEQVGISGPLRLAFFPSALGWLGHQTLLQGLGADSDVADFAVHHRLNPLQVGEKPSLGNGGDVGANAALFLGFSTAPNNTALDRALAC